LYSSDRGQTYRLALEQPVRRRKDALFRQLSGQSTCVEAIGRGAIRQSRLLSVAHLDWLRRRMPTFKPWQNLQPGIIRRERALKEAACRAKRIHGKETSSACAVQMDKIERIRK